MIKFSKLDRVYTIAEIGINHNGSMDLAKKLIDASYVTGWDCVKFQKRTPDICVPEKQKNIMRSTPWGKMKYIDYKHKIEFEKKEYNEIKLYSKSKPIDWTVSVWDLPSLNFILKYDYFDHNYNYMTDSMTRTSYGFEVFPLNFLELKVQMRTHTSENFDFEDEYLIQVHTWF